MKLDIANNREAKKWTKLEQLGRILWWLVHPIFRFSPRPFWFLRRYLLRLFGASVGKNAHIYPTVRIAIPWNLTVGDYSAIGDSVTLYALGPIHVGCRTTLSQGAHICAGTHDLSKLDRPLLKPPIVIGDDVWVCADAFVGPSVSIGDSAIVGARAVVMSDVPPNSTVVGNPSRIVKLRGESVDTSG